jgi:hypothetical protein
LVGRLLKLHMNLPKARTAPDKTAIERQIAATDKRIDQLVYELYGLTEDEIRIVEGDSATMKEERNTPNQQQSIAIPGL